MVASKLITKTGYNAGTYEVFVSDEDAHLLERSWSIEAHCSTCYAVGYLSRQNGKQRFIRMHRVILSDMVGRPLEKSEETDHIDGNGLNNCRDNLRLATHSQNNMNKRIRSDNTSGYKGVTYDKRKKKYFARIYKDGKVKYLGYFKTPEEAYEVRVKELAKYHGEFARPD